MNVYLFGTILNMATILMTAGCGSFLSVKSGNFNLGGEGQVYAGGFVAAVSLYACRSLHAVIAVPLCFLLSGLAAAFMAFIPAVLKKYRHVDVLLSSFLISAGIIPLIDAGVAGPFRGETNNLLATAFIPDKFVFSSILNPSRLNGTFFAAIVLCVVLFLIMSRTEFGQQLEVYGISPEFAVYSGYSETKLTILSVTVSGFLHGIAGFFCVAGTYATCHSGFYAGFGWNALSVALISQKNPLFIMPAAVVLAGLTTGASQFSMMHNFGFDMGTMLQGVILFLIVFSPSLVKLFTKLFRKGGKTK